eukprot:TRINITY_DN33845_c0_g1_i2.p1 TRINITY_DN33845_c0_g1~~TRINITY_DN33845_c0_g1_i2.p1  ORF type:complete len:681 (+),score=94.05 TRINITY_DN33845_c0_g1_i2:268-2310(+)
MLASPSGSRKSSYTFFSLWYVVYFQLTCQHGVETNIEFTDWECRRVASELGQEQLLPWNYLRTLVRQRAEAGENVADSEAVRVAGVAVVRNKKIREEAFQECPLGTVFLSIVGLTNCLLEVSNPMLCEDEADFVMQKMFRRHIPFAVLTSSGWPVTHALFMPFVYDDAKSKPQSIWHSISIDDSANCAGHSFWTSFQEALDSTLNLGKPVVQELIPWIFSPYITELEGKSFRQNSRPRCKLGWVAILLTKVCLSWHTETAAYYTYVDALMTNLERLTPWEFFGSKWFLSVLIGRVSILHRTVFELDFHLHELLTDALPVGHLASLKLHGSQPFTETARAVLGTGAEPYFLGGEQRLFSYATYVWGEEYVKWIPAFILRFQAIGVHNLIVFSADESGHQLCLEVKGSSCVFLPTKTGLHRYSIPLALMNLGVDVFVMDFDVFPFQSPTSYIVRSLESYGESVPDFLVAGSFGDSCICNAFAFYRSTPPMRNFTRSLLSWLHENPFPHGVTQKALSAFLGEGPLQKPGAGKGSGAWVVRAERVIDNMQKPPPLNWSLLDPETEFSSARKLATSGWAGRKEAIVLFHFFHGGWLTQESALNTKEPGSSDDFEIFYNRSNVLCSRLVGDALGEECSPWQDQVLTQRVMASRVGDFRPATDLACQVLNTWTQRVKVADAPGQPHE